MIYELRTYTFHAGKLPAYLKLQEEVGRPVRGDDYGKCHGYWTAEFGALNQVWHLWSYASLDDRAKQRDALGQNKRWTTEYVPNVRPLLMRQDIRFLNPVKDINPPKTQGGVYELRIYRMHPGAAGPWAQSFRDIMPVREKYSPECRHLDRRGAAAERGRAYVELSRSEHAHDHPCRGVQGSGLAGLRRQGLRLDRGDAFHAAAAHRFLADEVT